MFHEYPLEKIINQLEKDNLLPAILFRTSRRQCDVDLQSVVKKKYLEIHPQHQQDIEIAVQDVIKKYEYEPMIFKKHSQYEALFKFGVGAHHAGQLLPWRLLLEEIMTKGLLKVLVATGTVAAGVDFPARSVVITAHSKRGNEGFKVLSPSEFQQMSGRAGRRGKDTVGFCFIAPNPYSDARILVDVAKSPPEPLKSAYYASPSTVLNLLKYRSLEELRFTVENSLAGFVDHKDSLVLVDESKLVEQEIIDSTDLTNERKKLLEKKVKRIKRKSEELRLKQITQLEASIQALTNMGYIDEKGSLTTKGKWAAELCTTYVLEFSEAINDFLFDDLSVEELISLVASISGDSHRSYLTVKKSEVRQELFDAMKEKVLRVKENYKGSPYLSEVSVQPEAGVTVMEWVYAKNWLEYASLLKLCGVADGDASRIISQTADQLQQIGRLTESHPNLARQALDARSLLMKPPISNEV